MITVYNPELKAHLTLDDMNRVRHILQSQKYYLSEMDTAREAAADYLQTRTKVFNIPPSSLERLHLKTTFLDPREEGVEYREYDAKRFFASTTVCYYQTVHNTPVWGAGTTVTVKENPFRITHAAHYGREELNVELPDAGTIERVRAVLIRVDTRSAGLKPNLTAGESVAQRAVPLTAVFAARAGRPAGRPARCRWWPAWCRRRRSTLRSEENLPHWVGEARATRGLFWVYQYKADDRVPRGAVNFLAARPRKSGGEAQEFEWTLPLPPVPDGVRDGQHRLVVEVIFHLPAKRAVNWRAFVDVGTGAVLSLRALTAGVSGLVFDYDPRTATGNPGMTPALGDAALNPLQNSVVLSHLAAPVGGVQSLTGTHVTVRDDDIPAVAAPTKATGTNFNYFSRTNDFAAVNAYYHANNVFNVIEALGFNPAAYFDGTAFPVHIDHRASLYTVDGLEREAFCNGDAEADGIGLVGYCLSDLTDPSHPLGRAVDKWAHWHEIGGHGILWDHVHTANFGFAHSAGDALAAFQNDPVSHLRVLPERFRYAPFAVWLDRWFNRSVADGWGWGGSLDNGPFDYNAEQILATTLFRFYSSVGGDAADEPKRWQASRASTYLVLNAVGKLMPGTNPPHAAAFYNTLAAADADDWTTEGWAGGAYRKVLRWAFEKQGLWRPAGVPTTAEGAPDPVDLYIDDGRAGEYPYQAVHWNCPSVWNRVAADGGATPEPAVAGVTGFAYVKVKNRGTTDASGTVKVYHCLPGAGLIWPTDFAQAGPASGLPTGIVLAKNGNEVIVGPFSWTPNVNVHGHDCLLAVVEADGDPSNVSNLEPGQTIPEWRLVPHDNNIGQRNVVLLPGNGEALAAVLDGTTFFACNSFNRPAKMVARTDVPRALAAMGWGLQFDDLPDNTFRLKPGEHRVLRLRLVKGEDFTSDDIRNTTERNFTISLYGNGILLGGMTYHIDTEAKDLTDRNQIAG